MKKNILLLLVSSLLSLGTAQAAHNHAETYPATSTIDVKHPAVEVCPGEKKDLKTTNTGKYYDWYKFNTTTNQYEYTTSTGAQTNTARPAGKYLCAITKENSGGNVNLLTAGNFNFECHDTQHRNINGDNYFGHTKDGITYLMRELNCNANDNTYPGGFTCIKENANGVKPSWFKEVINRKNDGSKMLVCDGMNSADFKVWIAENVPVQAGVTYEFSCNIANVDIQYKDTDTNGDHGPNSLPRLRFWVEQNGRKTQLSQFEAPRTIGEFRQETATYTATSTGKCTIYIQNYTTFDEGNDFAIDDIYFGEPQNSTTTKLESFEIVEINCSTTATETKNYTPCIGTTCTLSPVTAGGTATWKDKNGNTVTNLTINIVDDTDLEYICTVETTGSNGHPLTITETHTINPDDCSTQGTETKNYDPCLGAEITLTAITEGSYEWSTGETTKSINISSAKDETITCTVTNTIGGIKHTVTESHVIKTKNCDTSDEQTEQVEKGGSITLVVPESKRCKDEDGNCEYIWYKKVNGELIIVDRNPIDIYPYAHTIDNADESEYICEIIKPSTGQKHTETYKIEILDAETVCYDASSTAEQTKTITGYEGENHAWYWAQGEDKVEFPEGYVTTDGNTITLDLSKFSNGSQPTDVKIIHEYDKEKEVIEEEEEEEEEEDPTNPMRFKITFEEVLSKSQFDGNKTITFDEYTKLVISENYRYTNTFNNKYETDIVHEGVLRITDNGLNSTVATGDDNTYFMDIDAGSKTGELFTIYSTGNFKKGEKYMFTFLLKNTTSDATKYPANIGCSLKTNTGEEIVLKEAREIEQIIWQTYIKIFEIEQDAESLEITFTSNNNSPIYNDFALDNIELTTDIPEYLRNAQLRATTVDTWKEEITLTINPITHQDIVETSNPDKEFKTEVKLDYNNKNEYVTFFYDPAVSYIEGSDKYVDYKEATNFYGCPHLVSFTLNLFSLEPDKFFSPNGDGVHDRWMVEGIETAPNAHIMIYDRHSKLLYKGKGSDFQGWDGNYNNHGMVQDDYWYVILVPETNETISGHFILKR